MRVASVFLDEIHRLLMKELTQRKADHGISEFILIFSTKFPLFIIFP